MIALLCRSCSAKIMLMVLGAGQVTGIWVVKVLCALSLAPCENSLPNADFACMATMRQRLPDHLLNYIEAACATPRSPGEPTLYVVLKLKLIPGGEETARNMIYRPARRLPLSIVGGLGGVFNISKEGHSAAPRLLLEQGADVNFLGGASASPLKAARCEHCIFAQRHRAVDLPRKVR